MLVIWQNLNKATQLPAPKTCLSVSCVLRILIVLESSYYVTTARISIAYCVFLFGSKLDAVKSSVTTA